MSCASDETRASGQCMSDSSLAATNCSGTTQTATAVTVLGCRHISPRHIQELPERTATEHCLWFSCRHIHLLATSCSQNLLPTASCSVFCRAQRIWRVAASVLPPGDELHVLVLYVHAPIRLCGLILIHSISLTSV